MILEYSGFLYGLTKVGMATFPLRVLLVCLVLYIKESMLLKTHKFAIIDKRCIIFG